MAPVEWPIAPVDDGGPLPARITGGGRLPVVRTDFFLDPNARLTEQERALMTAMLSDLVASVADEFKSLLADAEPANDDGELFDPMWGAGLLDIPELIALLLRRAEEERIAAGIRATRAGGRARFLQQLVSDENSVISAAAMALVLARGRRRDRFDGPRIVFDDVSAETAVALANAVAAALRPDLASRLGPEQADERLAAAVRALVSSHDEGNRIESRLFDLIDGLDRAHRLDEQLIQAALDEAQISLLCEALARRSGIAFDCAWDHLTGGGGRLALLLRMASVARELAGEIAASTAEVVGSDAESEIHAFDRLPDDEVERARKWLRLDPGYRAAIGAMDAGHGQRTV